MIRHLHLITNPRGGVGDNVRLAKQAEATLNAGGIGTTVVLTEHAGHAATLVEGMETGEGDAICGVGGDGTMHELVNGMMKRPENRRVPLTLLPGGTGNSFLRDLDCLAPESVLDRIASAARRSIDLFEVSVGGKTHYGFNIVGWGLLSSANRLAESLRFLGRRRYDVAALLQIVRNRRFQASLEFDGESIAGGFTLVALSNTIHTGEGMRLAPAAILDDGRLDLLWMKAATRRELVRLFVKLGRGTHVDDPAVSYRQVSRLTLTTDEDLPVNLDGELIESGSFAVRVLPGALEVLF